MSAVVVGRKVSGLIEEVSLKIASDSGLEAGVHRTRILDRSIVRSGSAKVIHNY